MPSTSARAFMSSCDTPSSREVSVSTLSFCTRRRMPPTASTCSCSVASAASALSTFACCLPTLASAAAICFSSSFSRASSSASSAVPDAAPSRRATSAARCAVAASRWSCSLRCLMPVELHAFCSARISAATSAAAASAFSTAASAFSAALASLPRGRKGESAIRRPFTRRGGRVGCQMGRVPGDLFLVDAVGAHPRAEAHAPAQRLAAALHRARRVDHDAVGGDHAPALLVGTLAVGDRARALGVGAHERVLQRVVEGGLVRLVGHLDQVEQTLRALRRLDRRHALLEVRLPREVGAAGTARGGWWSPCGGG